MTARDVAKWARMPYLAFDVETTGVDSFEDRIVSAALVRVEDGREVSRRTWLVNPGVEIAEEAIAVHGITNERAAAEGMDPAQAMFEITGLLAVSMRQVIPTVVANAPFDLTMLEAENRRHGIDSLHSRLAGKPIGPVIDPMVLDKKVDPYRKGICPCGCGATSKKLSELCKHYKVQLTDAHDAGADALAAALLVPAVISRYPHEFRAFTVGGLHQAQIVWAAEQKNSLRKYFEREGIEHDGCDPAWPVRRTPVETAAVQGSLL